MFYSVLICRLHLEFLQVFHEADITKKKPLKKITKQRLTNIALYYLQRFESSVANLKALLLKKINAYALQNPDFDKSQAFLWVDEILESFQVHNYLNDARFAEMRIRDYLAAGKSEKYIKTKLFEKGISPTLVAQLLSDFEFSSYDNALRLAKKKRIGPYREEANRKAFWQKDMGVLVRAGFDYDVALKVMETQI